MLLYKDLSHSEAVNIIKEHLKPKEQSFACVETFGCQQNVHDSEIIKGILSSLGFTVCPDRKKADIIIFNTCAVRESAEEKVLGKIGALKQLKKKKSSLIIGICGCMTEQEKVSDFILSKFPFVNFIFGTSRLERLAVCIANALDGKRTRDTGVYGDISEELPVVREDAFRANISVMYGCNNFCSYCIVPYVRGRERSREPERIIEEVTGLAAAGCREFTLLGQNVNSYGKTLSSPTDFSSLLSRVCRINGDFWVRFMTSHPKDITKELIDVMASEEKVCSHLHLPVQSGSDRILKAMNRKYDTAHYLSLIEYAKEKIPGITITTDIIVGFPGETDSDFEDTLELLKTVRYDNVFSFIYSKRNGTPAAEIAGQVDKKLKHERFDRLIALQAEISKEKNDLLLGKTLKVLVTGPSDTNPELLSGRTEGNKIVHFRGGKELTGSFCSVRITKPQTWLMYGEAVR